MAITSISGAKKKATVNWRKATAAERKHITGYKIQYSTDPSFKKAKSMTGKKNTYKKVVLSKLSSGKRYYVRLQSYYTVKVKVGKKYKSKTYYSPWSASKTVVAK